MTEFPKRAWLKTDGHENWLIGYAHFPGGDYAEYVLAAAVQAERAKHRALASVAERFMDADECQLDHHGYCQAHGCSDKPCSMVGLRAALAASEKALGNVE